MSVTLTKEYAKIIDDTLAVLLKDYEKLNMQTYDMVRHATKGKSNNPNASGAELIAAFTIASTYSNAIPYKAYTIEHSNTINITVGKTDFTEVFLSAGGFTAIWQKEQESRDNAEELRRSVIATNKNSRIVAWVAVTVAIVSATGTVMNYTKKDQTLILQVQKLQQQVRAMELKSPPIHSNPNSGSTINDTAK